MAKTKKKTGKSTKKAMQGPYRRTCACMQAHMGLLDRYPEFRGNQARIQHYTNYFILSGDAHRILRTRPRKIPVVVHVVYKKASENITGAQIKSQISVLNRDFRKKNADISKIPNPFKAFVADTMVEFTLAKKDPRGKPTKGITRTKTDVDTFSHDGDPVKFTATGGIEPWNTKRYLNIWVCTLTGGLLGYAQFPGGPEDTDGVVVRNTAFGTTGTAQVPFNKGRTATHEIGHYLNLSHIWGNSLIPTCIDSDFVDDTPNQFGPNTGKPTFPRISCDNGPNGDMFMNYMDYVDDDSMFMFTQGQVARMKAALEDERKQLDAGTL
jgi:hypothetical protein